MRYENFLKIFFKTTNNKMPESLKKTMSHIVLLLGDNTYVTKK